MRVELPWDGSELAIESSLRGELEFAANELRAPFVFEVDGLAYLLYAGAGEKGIGLTRGLEKQNQWAPEYYGATR